MQLPDNLLGDSAALTMQLRKKIREIDPSVRFYILGDTSYGACCVDEVAAGT
jgi:diphthamide biosynthesis protein 2